MDRSGNTPTVGFRVAYPVEVRVAHLVDGLRIRVACLVDALSGGLMHDVAGFGFLVAEGDGDELTVGFRVAYPVEVRVAHLVDVFGFKVACLVDAWSGSLMLDVAGFGFLVAVADGDGEKPETRHRQASDLPDH